MEQVKFRAFDKENKVMYIDYNWKELYNPETNNRFSLTDFINDEDTILMQYTWLCDMDWKEIYEGDILYVNHDWTPVKEIVEYKDGWFKIRDEYLWSIIKYRLELIWNIYENPELTLE